MGHKPRPARSLDPCRQPDLFTPFQHGGCVSGTAPASPSWRWRRDVGAEHRNPRLHPGAVMGRKRGVHRVPLPPSAPFPRQKHPFLYRATHGIPGQGIRVGCLISRPCWQTAFQAVPTLLRKRTSPGRCPVSADEAPALQAHGQARVKAHSADGHMLVPAPVPRLSPGGAERKHPPTLLPGDVYPGQRSWVTPTPGSNLAW